jgi:hypothetical protein
MRILAVSKTWAPTAAFFDNGQSNSAAGDGRERLKRALIKTLNSVFQGN